ncbi:extracellular solute-binding protein [Salibacterium aidingense]|uniref:extracellular solute-binding protein n=1 Tax=Salibacterium aidingense TaxID=384933 RepID=UPI003BE655D4
MKKLYGMTWDHPRGIEPLKATTKKYEEEHPGISIEWNVRSLKDFEDYPIELLVEKYDLIMMDHPFIGQGVKKEILEPLDNWFSKAFLREQQKNSVGPSYKSYTWNGKQWALAADAAAQVSAYRKDILKNMGSYIPQSWEEVFDLASELPDGKKIGLPLNPTHSFTSFLTLCANIEGKGFWSEVNGINQTTGKESLNILQRLSSIVHEKSFFMNPIALLDFMAETEELVYSPLVYGYVNYSLPSFRNNIIHFSDMPSTHSLPAGSVLGGVGMMISAFSSFKHEAADYMKYLLSEKCQCGIYFKSGGQPGHRSAWKNSEVNKESHGFFKNTLQTLDEAYVRPRFNGYPSFQEEAGELIHRALIEKTNGSNTIDELNELYKKAKVKA